MQRLAVCISAFEYGGQGTVVEQELLNLRDAFDVTLMTDVVSRPVPAGVEVVIAKFGNAPARQSRSLVERMRRMDIVHCHDSLKYMWAANHAAVPWIVTCHGICPLRFRASKRSQLEGGVTMIAYPWLYRRATTVVAISAYIRQWLRNSARVSSLLIPNGLEEVDAVDFSRPTDRSLLYVGEVSRRKGIDMLLQGLAALPDDVTLDIVGKGAVDHYRAVTATLQLNGRVNFRSEITDSELRDSYRSTFAVVSASHWEGFGLPVLEGFGHGRPALVRSVGGLKELVDRSGGGYTFSSAHTMRSAFDQVAEHWEPLSQSATRFAAGQKWSQVFDQYAELFSDTVRSAVCP